MSYIQSCMKVASSVSKVRFFNSSINQIALKFGNRWCIGRNIYKLSIL